jgi:hypothetical protein
MKSSGWSADRRRLYMRLAAKRSVRNRYQSNVLMSHTLDIEPAGDVETRIKQITHLPGVGAPTRYSRTASRLMVSIGEHFRRSVVLMIGTNTAYDRRELDRETADSRQACWRNPRQLAVLFLDILIGEHQRLRSITAPVNAESDR